MTSRPSRISRSCAFLRNPAFVLATLCAPMIPTLANALPLCGPGQHWVDTCAAGSDTLPSSSAIVGISFDNNLTPEFNAVLVGPTVIQRSPPQGPDPGHLNHIPTEIVSLNLTGGGLSLVAGAGSRTGGNLQPSLGRIIETASDPALADSFFDVFFEIQGTSFGPLRNLAPLRMDSQIDRVPPPAIYEHVITDPIGLFRAGVDGLFGTEDDPVDPSLWLVTAKHATNIPEPASWVLLGMGIGLFALQRRRRAAT